MRRSTPHCDYPHRLPLIIAAAAIALTSGATAAAQDARGVQLETVKVAKNVYVIYGQGGNIGLSIGPDGAFMIDDQFAPLTGRILDEVAQLTDKPVKFLINTHWHFDHTGGNENMGEAGAVIVAHENVRKRMSTDQFMEAFNREVPAAPDAALPVITFTTDITFHWNDDEVRIVHLPHAHTDGDAVIHFKDANVIHMGDIYFSNGYPFIDVGSGGSIDGMIRAVDRVLELTDDRTRIIPGHGPVTGIDELREYRELLKTLRGRIAHLIHEGASRDEVIAARPTAEFDEKWGRAFMQPDVWVGIVYDSLVRARHNHHHHDQDHVHNHDHGHHRGDR